MSQHMPTRQSANSPNVPVMISAAALRSRAVSVAASAALGLCLFASNPALAATPCCGVTDIAPNGQVTAREINGTRTIRFQVTDTALLRRLKPGAPVYANFDTKQVSLDGKRTCCRILQISTAALPSAPRSAPAAPDPTTTQPEVATEAVAGVASSGFDSRKHGFEFTNYFTGDVLVDLPLIGQVDLGNTTYGLCGGMVFAALDTFKLDAIAPDVPATPPSSGTSMRSYLYERQINSFKYSDGFLVRRLVAWMRKPLKDVTTPNPLAEGGVNVIERGLIHLSGKEFKDKIRPELDAGKPVPIVLVKASGEDMVTNPKAAFTKNHQVLAIGYQRHGDEWDIHIYDPNMPNTAQTLHVDGRYQTRKGSTDRTGKFRGFFEAPYRLERPPWVPRSQQVAGQIKDFKVKPFPKGDRDD